jgi:hypothetical protein
MIAAQDSDCAGTESGRPSIGHRGRIDLATRRLLYPVASLLLFLPLFFQIYRPAAGGLDVTGHQIGRDFINVWAGPQLAFGGRLETLFDLQAYHAAIGTLFGHPLPFHNWGYPLFTLPAFWPLAQLPYFVALAVWSVGLFGVSPPSRYRRSTDRTDRTHCCSSCLLPRASSIRSAAKTDS